MANKDASTAIVRRGTLGVFKRGVGTATPTAKLDLRGSDGYLKFDSSGSDATIKSDYNLRLYGDDTGDNSSGYQNIQFYTAGANERMRIDSAGKVGVGTTAPTARLNVKASGSTVDQIAVTHSGNTVEIAQLGQSANGNSAGALLLKNNGGTDKVYLDAAGSSYFNGGNVGIGTTAPSELLEVKGSGANIRISSDANTYLSLDSTQTNGDEWQIFNAVSGTTSGLQFKDVDTSKLVMLLQEDGKVGIGTASPNGKLHLYGAGVGGGYSMLHIDNTTAGTYVHSAEILAPNMTSGQTHVLFIGRAASSKNAGYLGYVYDSAGSNSNLLTLGHWSGNHLVNIRGDGKVGIGTTGPGEILTLDSSSNTRLLMREGGSNKGQISAGGGGLYIQNLAGDVIFRNISDADTVRIKNNGNVGIGTTAPTEKLEVEGSLVVNVATGSGLGEEGIFFRSGYSTSYKYNVSILSFAHDGSGNFSDGLSINGYDGVSFCTGSNSRLERMRIVGGTGSTSGYVGIGTTAPNAILDISDATNDNLRIGTRGGNMNLFSVTDAGAGAPLAFEGTQFHFVAGNVGIGTTFNTAEPYGGKLWVQGDRSYLTSSGNGHSTIRKEESALILGPSSTRTGTAGHYVGGIGFDHLLNYSVEGKVSYHAAGPHCWIGMSIKDTPGYERSALVFATRTGTGGSDLCTEKMRVQPDGKVGIGTTAPDSTLELSQSGNHQLKVTETGTGCETVILSQTGNGGEGWIGTQSSHILKIGTAYSAKLYLDTSGHFRPSANGTQDFGNSSFRWNNVYSEAGNFSGDVTVSGRVGVSMSPISTAGLVVNHTGDYILGLYRSGTPEWFFKTYTNGNFAIHENGVGDKFTIAAGGNATFNNELAVSAEVDASYGLDWALSQSIKGRLGYGTGFVYVGTNTSGGILKLVSGGGSTALTLDASLNATFAGNAVVTGNLTVNGTATTIDTTNLVVEDPLILLARNQTGQTLDSGFIIERGSHNNAGFIWDESADRFACIQTTDTATTVGNVTIANYANLQAGNITTGGQILTPGGSNLALNPNTGLVTVGGALTTTGNITGGGTAIFTGDMTIADDFYFKATNAWIIAGSVAGGALTGGTLRIQNFGELEVDGVLDINGTGTSTFAGTITENSSIALKENIFDLNTTLDKINRVRPVKYNKKTTKNKKEIGFIAEELAEIFPELVENDKDGNPASVNYTRAVTVLFDGFKQMYKELKEIKERIK